MKECSDKDRSLKHMYSNDFQPEVHGRNVRYNCIILVEFGDSHKIQSLKLDAKIVTVTSKCMYCTVYCGGEMTTLNFVSLISFVLYRSPQVETCLENQAKIRRRRYKVGHH